MSKLFVLRDIFGVLLFLLMGIRLSRVAIAVIKQDEKWTQLLFPVFVIVEVVRLRLGATNRLTNIAVVTGAELLLALGAIVGMLRSRGEGNLNREERLYNAIRLFLPTRLASMMTQEVMILAESVLFFRRPAMAQDNRTKTFGYVQASPLRVLPLVLIVSCVPEVMISHFVLSKHEIIAGMLLVAAVWSVMWATGLYIAMRNRPHVLSVDTLRVRLGVKRWCDVPLADITATRLLNACEPKRKANDLGDFSMKHCQRIEILLSRPTQVCTLEGKGCEVSRLWVTADDVNALSAALVTGIR